MFIQQLRLTNFKNHEKKVFHFNEKMVAFIGLNGVGKTNCLDAIYFLCIGKSYFTSKDVNCIYNGQDFFRIEMLFNEKEKNVLVLETGKKKRIETNGNEIKKLSHFVGKYPVVIIAPNDNMLILGGSEERRKYIDQCLAQTDGVYLENIMKYNKVLKQRNSLLKNAEEKGMDKVLLQIYNEDLNQTAHYIYTKRKEFIEKVIPILESTYAYLSAEAEHVNLTYKSDLEKGEFLKKLEENFQKDILLKRTTKGIHKDDLVFEIENFSLKDYGSQGQQKTYLLALKLAQFQYIKNCTGKTPIFIVDDIFDKLDGQRSKKLMQFLQKEQGQVFLSNTTSSIFDTFEMKQLQIIELN
ncbi:MAG: DNA replication and repair protein RecF [Chitinophagales bacterium]|nr:DNA replication and repair protein RecF [Chitinophagales bacterium]